MSDRAITITLSEDEFDTLNLLAREREMDIDTFVHEALVEWLRWLRQREQTRKLWLELAEGLGESDVKDGADQHDAYPMCKFTITPE